MKRGADLLPLRGIVPTIYTCGLTYVGLSQLKVYRVTKPKTGFAVGSYVIYRPKVSVNSTEETRKSERNHRRKAPQIKEQENKRYSTEHPITRTPT